MRAPAYGARVAPATVPVRTEPQRRPVASFLSGLVQMHTASFMDLCLGDLADDQERLQRYCDQLALASGLRLSFTYGSVLDSMSSFVVIETNAPRLGFCLVVFATVSSCCDLIVVLVAVLISSVLPMVNSEDQLLYLALAVKRSLRVPLQAFWAASYTFALAFLCESYVKCHGLDAPFDDVVYDSSSLAFRGWLAGALAWMLPMPLVHAPVSLLIARLYQAKELLCDFDAPPVASEHGAWFADPSAAELRELLRAYLEAWGPSGFAGRFRNATPDHFAMFVLHRMRAKGHGSLSYVASKRIERVFEEWVDALLEEDKNAEETKE